jgi:DNA polymerase-3 subunit beta
MRFEGIAGPLAIAAQAAMKGTDVKGKLPAPILRNLLLTAAGDTITFTGTDLDHRVTAICAAEVEEAGAVTVDGRVARWLSALDGETIVKAKIADGRLHARAGRGSARIDSLPASDFPIFVGPGAERTTGIEGGQQTVRDPFTELALTAEQRHTIFVKLAHAIANEATRYYLCGVYLHSNDNKLVAVSTNGHMLMRVAIPLAATGILKSSGVIIPGPACAAISKLSGVIRIDHRSVEAIDAKQTYSSKLIDGIYPNYTRVIPGPSDRFAMVDRADLIASLKRLETLGDEVVTNVGVRFEWGTSGLRLSLKDTEAGSDEMEADIGEPAMFGASARYMIAVLQSFSGETIKIEASDPGSPVKITAADPELLAVLMPMRI